MTKTEIVRRLDDTRPQLTIVESVRAMQSLPNEIESILSPLVTTADRIDQALSAQRQVVETLTREAVEKIGEQLQFLNKERLTLRADLSRLKEELDDLSKLQTSLRRQLQHQKRQARLLLRLAAVAVVAAIGVIASVAVHVLAL